MHEFDRYIYIHSEIPKYRYVLGKRGKNPLFVLGLNPRIKECLKEIVSVVSKLNSNWLQIGTLTKSGYPRHPSRAAYNMAINKLEQHILKSWVIME